VRDAGLPAVGAHDLRSHYHFVFITKYRKPVLREDIGTEVREVVREVWSGESLVDFSRT
jgi:hypothetical protein